MIRGAGLDGHRGARADRRGAAEAPPRDGGGLNGPGRDNGKRVDVAPRPPGVPAGAFARRWREHARLAISDDLWRSAATWYEFFDPVDVDAEPLDGEAANAMRPPEDLGGLCIVKFADPNALSHRLADPAFATMLFDDESRVFGRRLGNDLFPVNERVLLDRAVPDVTLVGVVHRRRELAPSAFAEHWEATGLRLLQLNGVAELIVRYRLNISPPEAPYDGILELGFASIRDANAFLDSAVRRDVHGPDVSHCVDGSRGTRFLARSEILHRSS